MRHYLSCFAPRTPLPLIPPSLNQSVSWALRHVWSPSHTAFMNVPLTFLSLLGIWIPIPSGAVREGPKTGASENHLSGAKCYGSLS